MLWRWEIACSVSICITEDKGSVVRQLGDNTASVKPIYILSG